MRLENNLDKILIIDFGSQFTQLIARKVRELNVFCEIISHNKLKDYKNEKWKYKNMEKERNITEESKET